MPTNGLKWGAPPVRSSHAAAEQSRLASTQAVGFGDGRERARRVDLLRKAVETGVYRVDSLTIADRMLECGALDLGDES